MGNKLAVMQRSHWVKHSLNKVNTVILGVDLIMQVSGGTLAALYGAQYVPFAIAFAWWLAVVACATVNYLVERHMVDRRLSEVELDRGFNQFRLYRVVSGSIWALPLLLLYQPSFAVQDSLEVLAIYFIFSIWASLTSLVRHGYTLVIVPSGIVLLGALIAVRDPAVALVIVAHFGFSFFLRRVVVTMRSMVLRYVYLDYEESKSHALLKKQARDLEHLNKKISRNQERLELLAENSTDIIAMHDSDGYNLYINHIATEISGYSIRELLKKHPLELAHPDDRNTVLKPLFEKAMRTGDRLLGEYRILHKDGREIWIEASLRRLPSSPGHPVRMVSVSRDVTERHHQALELATRQQTLESSLRSIRDAVITLTAKGEVVYANSNARELFTLDSPVGHPVLAVLPLRNKLGVPVMDFHSLVQQGQNVYSFVHGERELVFDVSIASLKKPFSEMEENQHLRQLASKALESGYVLLLRDITERRELEEELRRRAYTDPLTSVLNRSAFDEQLRTLHERLGRVGGSHALVLVDLDQFKVVNDTAGHRAGDELLIEIANTLESSVRDGDVVARIGGDEFAILLQDCLRRDAEHRTQQVCDAVSNIHFDRGGKHYPVSASFGVAMFDDPADSVELVMGRADSACYVVKDQGRNGVHLWTKDNVDSGRQATDMDWVTRLHTAMNEQRIKIFGQHIWPLQDNDDGCQYIEILMSFRDIDGSLVSPVQFIPAAERYGLMPALDHYVVEAVFRYIAPLQQYMTGTSHKIAINLSGHTIGSEAALNNLRKLFHHYAIKPELICFEITETAALQNMAEAKRFLQTLKKMGCSLALDDFGTGFSSFSYLKSLPVDVLKIDGEFVREMLHSPTDYAIVEAVHKVGSEMGLVTVAECIENGSLLKEVTTLGVAYGQGHHLSERHPVEQLLNQQSLVRHDRPQRSA